METVLVVGATGNIGVSAILGALSAGKRVLAIVRNEQSAAKLFQHVGTKEGITTVEADVMSPDGVQGVVDKVRAGKLPAFQHVYATVGGGDFFKAPFYEQSIEYTQRGMKTLFEANYYAYRATIPYLLSHKGHDTSFTTCVGGAVDLGMGGVAATSQGALLGLINAAMRDTAETNVRVNEAYLAARVEFDTVAKANGSIPASKYGKVYERILTDTAIKGQRSTVMAVQDTETLRFEGKGIGALPSALKEGLERAEKEGKEREGK